MNLKDLSLEQLKVLFYDENVKFAVAQNNMTAINNEISSRSQVIEEAKVVEETKETKKKNDN